MEIDFKTGVVVVPLTGPQKGEVGMVNCPPAHGDTKIEVVFWKGYPTAVVLEFDPDNLILYQNPDKLIRSLSVGDEMVILEELRLLYNSAELSKRGQTIKIEIIEKSKFNDIMYYSFRENHTDFSFILENIDIPATNRLLTRKYGLPNRKNKLPNI